MKRWQMILAVAGAAATVASVNVAALSAAAAPVTELATPAVAGYCDHHTAAMDQMHAAMVDTSQMRSSMHNSMRDRMHAPRGATSPSGAMHMEVQP